MRHWWSWQLPISPVPVPVSVPVPVPVPAFSAVPAVPLTAAVRAAPCIASWRWRASAADHAHDDCQSQIVCCLLCCCLIYLFVLVRCCWFVAVWLLLAVCCFVTLGSLQAQNRQQNMLAYKQIVSHACRLHLHMLSAAKTFSCTAAKNVARRCCAACRHLSCH
jgi:hypothetical protein